ncbi:MAG: OmpH family outer membrane protein [Pseudomonadota bacterium]
MRPTATKLTGCRGPRACGVLVSGCWVALLMIIALASAPLKAQDASEPNLLIGFVDMVRLFDNAPQLIAAREALDEEFRPRYDALNADEARLETLNARRLATSDLNAETRQDLEREIRNLERSINRRREDLTQEIRFRTNAEKTAIEDTIQIAIRQVAEAGGFDLVLTGPVAFASERVDMTERVIEWLEQDYAADTEALGSLP